MTASAAGPNVIASPERPRPASGLARLRPAALLLLAVAFAVAHTQAPLYYSNQHQYFLHGLARGGYGLLDADWLANTRDPTPLFSAAVALAYRHVGEWPFQAAYFALLVVYFLSLVGLCDSLPIRPPPGLPRFGFLALLATAHAGVVRLASVRLAGVDYPWYLQSGVAGQYLLGPGLQPSAFGVLLLTSVLAFVRGRPLLAGLLAAAAAVVHATYLLPAALLTLAYLAVLWREGRGRAGLLAGAVTLLAVLPALAYHLRTFGPSSAAEFAEAQRLLAEVRIPHHAQVGRWLDGIAVAQIAWVGLALALVRRTRLFPALAVPAAASVLLTLLQGATGSHTLALLFPWRISAVLVPVATAVMLARLAAAAAPRLARRPPALRTALAATAAAVLAAVTAGGVAVGVCRLAYHMNPDELPLLEYVRAGKQPGDVYLIPVSLPKLGSGPRGSVSTSFTPPPRSRKDTHLIPVDFQRFRLATGAPIFVDFKSVPYQDREVLEWYDRLLRCQGWYARDDWGSESLRDELLRAGITHAVTTADRDPAPGWEQIYADDSYRLYRLRPAAGPAGNR